MAMSETTYDLMMNPRACAGFQWIGQSFAHCDNCGKPYWDHSHEDRLGRGGPFSGGSRRTVITRKQAEVCRRKWDQ